MNRQTEASREFRRFMPRKESVFAPGDVNFLLAKRLGGLGSRCHASSPMRGSGRAPMAWEAIWPATRGSARGEGARHFFLVALGANPAKLMDDEDDGRTHWCVVGMGFLLSGRLRCYCEYWLGLWGKGWGEEPTVGKGRPRPLG